MRKCLSEVQQAESSSGGRPRRDRGGRFRKAWSRRPTERTVRAVCAAAPRAGFARNPSMRSTPASIRVLWRGHHGRRRYAEAPLPPAPVLPRGRGALAYCFSPSSPCRFPSVTAARDGAARGAARGEDAARGPRSCRGLRSPRRWTWTPPTARISRASSPRAQRSACPVAAVRLGQGGLRTRIGAGRQLSARLAVTEPSGAGVSARATMRTRALPRPRALPSTGVERALSPPQTGRSRALWRP